MSRRERRKERRRVRMILRRFRGPYLVVPERLYASLYRRA
jgi:hypothetical protein